MAWPSLLWMLVFPTALGTSMAQMVTQTQKEMSVQEADSATLDCTYDTSDSNYYLFWYKQLPSGQMTFIIRQEAYKQQNATENRFSVNFQKAAKSFGLKISDSQLGDAAMYFCALSETGRGGSEKLSFGKGTKLTVSPLIENPEPAVYQLRDPKSSNNSICLFTDFSSQSNVSQKTEPGLFISDPTVLDMKSMDFKSNGALAWGTQTNFGCGAAFEKEGDNHSDVTCDAKLVEKSFETDMNLNFQNLSVMGLRIFLLKVAGFNLLMTLRLWSS